MLSIVLSFIVIFFRTQGPETPKMGLRVGPEEYGWSCNFAAQNGVSLPISKRRSTPTAAAGVSLKFIDKRLRCTLRADILPKDMEV